MFEYVIDDRPLVHNQQQAAHLMVFLAGRHGTVTDPCKRCSLWGVWVESEAQQCIDGEPLCQSCFDQQQAELKAAGVWRDPRCGCWKPGEDPVSPVCPVHNA